MESRVGEWGWGVESREGAGAFDERQGSSQDSPLDLDRAHQDLPDLRHILHVRPSAWAPPVAAHHPHQPHALLLLHNTELRLPPPSSPPPLPLSEQEPGVRTGRGGKTDPPTSSPPPCVPPGSIARTPAGPARRQALAPREGSDRCTRQKELEEAMKEERRGDERGGEGRGKLGREDGGDAAGVVVGGGGGRREERRGV
eukprot:762924-Hanusia_phi.AAC.4